MAGEAAPRPAVAIPAGGVLVHPGVAAALARLLRLGIDVDRTRNGRLPAAAVEAVVAELQRAGATHLQAALSHGESALAAGSKAAGVSSRAVEVNAREAADRLGVTPQRIGQLIGSGRLRGRKDGRAWLVEAESVEALKLSRGAA